ncbi:MAG: hypothetical protein JW866_06695 [Ignavibacteriales bacterium]|nr:hypothetical protein [Ignavibacteriales bacterium]
MDTIFLKINIKKTDIETEQLRNRGLLFTNIADVLNLERNSIEEIDETNYKTSINLIKKKYNDKSRGNKKSFRG